MDGLSTFIRVVEAGSFTAAARATGTTPSAISKSMARLETRLGMRLFQRSTRAFALTPEGATYFERVAPLVRGIEEAREDIGSAAEVTGHLRISMPADFGRLLVDALTGRFRERHPNLHLDLSLSDRHVDIIREGYDAAIRVGNVADTGLIARPLGLMPVILVASPDYLARKGNPKTIEEFREHAHIRYILAGRPLPISFQSGNLIPPEGLFDSDSGEAMRIAARNGLGIAQILRASVSDDLASGELVDVVPGEEVMAVPAQILHAFARIVPARVRVLFEFLDVEINRLRLL